MDAANVGKGPMPNSYWVKPGRLAAGEYPGSRETSDAEKKLRDLLKAGINHFVDLTEAGERTDRGKLVPYKRIADEEASKLGLSVQWERRPIADVSIPKNPEYMAEILNVIDSALGSGKTVYVHCWGGVGRTGTVIGCWLVRHGRTGDKALAQIAEWWQGMEKDKIVRHPRSPETEEQREYVRQWAEPPRLEKDDE